MSHVFRGAALAVIAAFAVSLGGSPARAADPVTYDQAVQKAISYLATTGQAADGSFGTEGVKPGVTGIVIVGILRNGRGVDDPVVAKALKFLESNIQPDGGIYDPKARQKNYETCLALVALSEANRDGRYAQAIKNADKYLKGLQFADGDTRTSADVSYGGVGYAGPQNPDLSNSQFLMDALQAAGNGPEDDAVKRALIFVSRCQNLETEFNTTPAASKNPDGGFYYAPSGGTGNIGRSQAGNTENGGLRSYGSMTYAGLKSMIFAGVKADDPRVKAAVEWLQKHYTLTENPGMDGNGLYYYYTLFGKALDAVGKEQFVDDKGVAHNWREELQAELIKRQQANGSWVNSTTRWMEGDPNLVTGYALMALSYTRPKSK